MSLKGKRILVTGVTGFIGYRLAERLVTEQQAQVTGLGRDPEILAGLTAMGVRTRQLDLRDLDGLHEAVQEQDVIFHLAAAKGTSPEEVAEQINVATVEILVREAAEAGVKRLVHVSSMAAYGPPDREVMAEDHPLDVEQEARYGRTKARGEQQALYFGRQLGLEVVVIRPGMVYGARGASWTLNLFKLVKRGVPVLFGGGLGHAHPIYVDNLIDGLFLAADHPQAPGEAFNMVDQAIPWRDFLAYYGAMGGRKPRGLPLWFARIAISLVRPFIGRTESADSLLTFYTNRSTYPTTKAQALLGYQARIDLVEGMRLTEAWLREAGYL